MRTFSEYKNRLRRLFQPHQNNAPAAPVVPEYNIPETLPINCRESVLKETRLNLLIPALSLRFSFGGINTAIEFFKSLAGDIADARIIVTDEAKSDLGGFSDARYWRLVSSDDPDQRGRSIVCFGDRYNKTIPVRQDDVFVATAWWTAYNGEKILSWQQEKWKKKPVPLVFLIQDFEPGFYKWSSRYFLALGTYYQKNMIAVVNTMLLYDYIKSCGIALEHCYTFEPTLNPGLMDALKYRGKSAKKRKIIFYGRPSVERNAYEVIVKGLEYWSFWYPGAKNWEVVSLGESYVAPKLGNDITITVKGKITIKEYAATLLESAIGISMMISPHPSYPPLEMAAFDLAVITNKFFNKNLSEYHDNLISLDNINPETIARLLGALCAQFEEKADCFAHKRFRNLNFLAARNGFNFVDDLRYHLLRNEQLVE
jgi:O-antigen biosynthesis protein